MADREWCAECHRPKHPLGSDRSPAEGPACECAFTRPVTDRSAAEPAEIPLNSWLNAEEREAWHRLTTPIVYGYGDKMTGADFLRARTEVRTAVVRATLERVRERIVVMQNPHGDSCAACKAYGICATLANNEAFDRALAVVDTLMLEGA